MATISYINATTNSIKVSATHNGNAINGYRFFVDGTGQGTGITSITQTTSWSLASYEYVNLSADQLYKLSVTVYLNGIKVHSSADSNGLLEVRTLPQGYPPGAISVTTQPEQTSIAPQNVSFIWTTTPNTTAFEYVINNQPVQETTQTSIGIGPKGAGTYSITVTPKNVYGKGPSSSAQVVLVDGAYAPSGLSVKVSGYYPAPTIEVAWNPSSNATGYKWSYTGNSSGNGDVGNATSKTITNFTGSPGIYTFYVTAYNNYGTGDTSSVNFTVSSAPTPGLIGLTLVPKVFGENNSGFTASWTIPSNTTQVNVGFVEPFSAETLDSSITSKKFEYMGENKTYHVYVQPFNGVNPGESVSQWVTTYSRPVGAPSNVKATAYANKTIGVTWDAMTSATGGYLVTANNKIGSGDVLKATLASYNTTACSFTVDSEFLEYTVKVLPRNSLGTGNTAGTVTVKTLDETKPTSSMTIGAVTDTKVTVNFAGADTQSTYNSGVAGYKFFVGYGHDVAFENLSLRDTRFMGDGSGTITLSGFIPATKYTIGLRVYDANNNSVDKTINITTSNVFDWSTPKYTGGPVLTAKEWNDFTNKINEVRFRKGLNTVLFTVGYTNDPLTAAMYNEAVLAIKDMSKDIPSSIQPPVLANRGDPLTAANLIKFVDSLKSLM